MKIPGISGEKMYPIVPVRDGIVFPGAEQVLLFGRSKSILAIDEALRREKKIILLMQKNPDVNDPKPEDLYQVGVLATIEKMLKGEQGEVSALVRGETRVRVETFHVSADMFEAELQFLPETILEPATVSQVEALVKHITSELKKAVNLGKGIEFVFLMNIMSGVSPQEFSNHVAMILDIKTPVRQKLLEEDD